MSDEAAAAGKGFADLSHWRKVAVDGAHAFVWLDGLVAADLAGLAPGRARHAVLEAEGTTLSFTVAVPGGTMLLIQDPAQPHSVLDALAPAAAAAGVGLRDRSAELALFAFPGRPDPPELPGTARSTPSCLGPGADLILLAGDHDGVLRSLTRTLTPLGPAELEAWRAQHPLGR